MQGNAKPSKRARTSSRRRADSVIPAAHEFDLKDRVFRVALEMFGERGFDAVSVDEIISRAEISKGGFYHHFTRKDDLLFSIEEVFMDHMVQAVEQAATRKAPVEDRLSDVLRIVVETVVNNRAYFRVFFREDAILATKRFRPIREKRARVDEIVRRVIQEGIANGEVRADLPADVTTSALFGMCLWTYRWFAPTAEMSTERLAEILGGIMFRGISTGARAASTEGATSTG